MLSTPHHGICFWESLLGLKATVLLHILVLGLEPYEVPKENLLTPGL